MFLEDALLGFIAFFSIVEWLVINFGTQCLFFCLKCSQLMYWHVMRSFPAEGRRLGISTCRSFLIQISKIALIHSTANTFDVFPKMKLCAASFPIPTLMYL